MIFITLTAEKALKFKHIGEICKAYEKCYILGVHQAILSDTPLKQSCVDIAIMLVEKPRLFDLHVKKVGFYSSIGEHFFV